MISADLWVSLVDREGRLERPLTSGRWRIPPAVDVNGDRLVWINDPGPPVRYARSGKELLEHFVRLADAPAERIKAYARRWGVLNICEHGLPASHNPPPVPLPPKALLSWCRPLGWPANELWEPLEVWRRYSRQMRAFLNIAARLHEGDLGRLEDWRVLYYQVEDGPVPWWKRVTAADRRVVTLQLKEWLAIGRVELEPSWDEEPLALRLGVAGLFGALAVQLALAISRTDGLAVCSGCGISYIPSRRPKANRRRYCPECRRRKVPGRDAATGYRQRIAEAQRLAKEGVTLREIAQRLSTDLATVRGWIRRQSG
jgi:hypothetical protein